MGALGKTGAATALLTRLRAVRAASRVAVLSAALLCLPIADSPVRAAQQEPASVGARAGEVRAIAMLLAPPTTRPYEDDPARGDRARDALGPLLDPTASADVIAVPASAGAPALPALAAADLSTLARGGIPARVLKAYQAAAARQQRTTPRCALTWPVLAGIGRVESDHGRDVAPGGGITPDGTITPPILGPALDGTRGTAAIRDATGAWARATGPMQFLSTTWQLPSVGIDGNGDGRADANNIDDAALGAARYLCAGGRVLSDPVALRAAVFSYNHSDDYVRLVLGLIAQYARTDPTVLLRGAGLLPVGPAAPPKTPTAPAPAPPRPVQPTPTPSPAAPRSQTVVLAPVPAQTWPAPDVPLVARGGGSSSPVVLTAAPAEVCTVKGSALTLTGVGTCTVTATQAGAPGWLAAAPVVQQVPVGYQVTLPAATTGAAGADLTVRLSLPEAAAASTVVATAVDGTALTSSRRARTFAPAAGSWSLVLPTDGLAAGDHVLEVMVSGDPTVHSLWFTLTGRLPSASPSATARPVGATSSATPG